jgi:hypothetical protein
MSHLQIKTDPKVEAKFNKYPPHAREKIEQLRKLVLEAAEELENIGQLEETLKWGEPSYLVKKGSTIRMDWKEKAPEQYAIYFKCTSKLVPTFRALYSDVFTFEGNRAIVFQIEDKIPEAELINCIQAALQYHKVKELDDLGMS